MTLNTADRRIKGIAFEFRNGLDRRAYYERVTVPIGSNAAYTSGQQNHIIFLPGGPNAWSVRVAGVLFEDGDVWGSVPPPPPPPPPPVPPSPESMRQLEQAPETAIQFKNSEGAPVSITAASVKAVRLDGQARDGLAPGARSDYLIRLVGQFVNTTDRRVIGLAIGCATQESMTITNPSVVIEPRASLKLELPHAASGFIVVHGSVERLETRVVGVRFEDGEVWGHFLPPLPPPPPPPPPPQSSDLPQIIRKSGGVLVASAIKRVDAKYPPLARAAKVNGTVVVEITVDETGDVISARPISGHPLLKDAAVDAARQRKFSPTTLAGEAVKVVGTLTFNFAL